MFEIISKCYIKDLWTYLNWPLQITKQYIFAVYSLFLYTQAPFIATLD